MEKDSSIIDWIFKISILLGIFSLFLIRLDLETIFIGYILLITAVVLFLSPFFYYFLEYCFEIIKESKNKPLFTENLKEKKENAQIELEKVQKIEFVIKLLPVILGIYFFISEIYFLSADYDKISINETSLVILFGLRLTMIFVWPLIFAKDLVNTLFDFGSGDIMDSDIILQTDLFHKAINFVIIFLIIIRIVEIIL